MKFDDGMHWINLSPVDTANDFLKSYLLDSGNLFHVFIILAMYTSGIVALSFAETFAGYSNKNCK